MAIRFETYADDGALAESAADAVADHLKGLLARQPRALVMFATGASQIRFLDALVARPGIEWPRVDMCHLDQYVGLAPDHPASFVRYLTERVTSRLPLGSTLMIDGLVEPAAECARLNQAMAGRRVDLALVGIGENGHLAFNDPPADFTTTTPFCIVELDQACRQQQVREGWFPDVAAVLSQAISASIRFILSARRISCVVPGPHKAVAVRDCLTGPISPVHPASALRWHNDTTIYLDTDSAALLPPGMREPR